MGIEHVGADLLLLLGRRAVRLFALEQFALRRGGPIRVDVEYLIEPETSQETPAALTAMDDVKMAVPKFLQAQRHARHRAHKGGIHHRAILQVHDKFAVATVDHLAGKFLEIAAVEEASLALDFHPNGIAVYPDLN